MKKVLTIVLVIAMLVAVAIPAFAKAPVKEELTWTDGFGFHCNAKGNPATAVEYVGVDDAFESAIAKIKKQPAGSLVVQKGDQKDIFGTKANPIDLKWSAGTTFDLLTDDIECVTCGRIDWVTFSNNNGVINGKNIQAHHSGTPRYMVEVSIFWTAVRPECDFECNEEECEFECPFEECLCGEGCEACECICEEHTCVVCGCVYDTSGLVETFKVPSGPFSYEYEYENEEFTLKNITNGDGNVVNFPVELPAVRNGKFSFTFNFEALGDCACDFELCEYECGCDPCEDPSTGEFFRECDHAWHCPNCIGNGNDQQNQGHKNCVVYHSGQQGNIKFECIDCKAQAHSKDVLGGIYCACTLCN